MVSQVRLFLLSDRLCRHETAAPVLGGGPGVRRGVQRPAHRQRG